MSRRLSGGVLTVSLQITTAAWHSLGTAKPGIELLAFNEVGKAPELPGPLLRVPAGTAMQVRVTNAADTVMVVHDLSSRSTATMDSLVLRVVQEP